MAVADKIHFKIGDKFSSYEELHIGIRKYMEQNFVDLHIDNSFTLVAARKRYPKFLGKTDPKLRYYNIKYKCVHGGDYRKQGKDIRRTSTLRKNCGAFIYARLDDQTENLVISSMSETHNHPVSEVLYNHLPNQRRLPTEIKKKVLAAVQLGANKKLIQDQIMKKENKMVYLKDLVHFEESEFENKRDDNWKKLKPNAVPTLFNVPNPPPQNLSKRKKGIDLPKPRSILDTAEKIVSEHQVLPTNPSEGSQMEQPQSPSEQESAVDNVNETVPPTSQITEKTGAPRTTVKRKMPSTVPQPSSSKIKKVLQDPEIDFMSSVIEKLQNISNHCASQTRNEDSYDCFGKYVASMLRNIGPPTAMRLQETITSLIIDAMCPTQSPAN